LIESFSVFGANTDVEVVVVGLLSGVASTFYDGQKLLVDLAESSGSRSIFLAHHLDASLP